MKLYSIRPALLLISLLAMTSMDAQEMFKPFKTPVESAIQHNKSIQNAMLENQKVVLDQQAVKGKSLPHLSVNALYGYLHTGVDVDIPARTLPITGITLFEESAKGNFSTHAFASGL